MTARSVAVSIEVPLSPEQAFDSFAEELALRLGAGRDGVSMRLDPRPGGRLLELRGGEEVEVARVREWRPAERVVLQWHPGPGEVEVRFEPLSEGTRITLEHRDFGKQILALAGPEDAGGELLGWFADQVAGPLVLATGPWGLGAWQTDRWARSPTGPLARESFRDPAEHRPGFEATLEALALEPEDVLLEIGCGGGAFMRDALHSGCRAVALDHSEEMVRLTRQANADAVAAGRLEVVRADAERLPFEDGAFTCVAMTHVFFFLRDPLAVLRECRRVLADGGRLAAYTTSAELKGTPAAPEPIAGHMRFYTDAELEGLAREADFAEASVARHGGAQLLVASAGRGR